MDEETVVGGIHYDVERQIVVVDGVIVRDVASFPLGARPHRASRAVARSPGAGLVIAVGPPTPHARRLGATPRACARGCLIIR